MAKTTLVIPTYNEKDNIEPLLASISEVYENGLKNKKSKYEFAIEILSRKEKNGLGRAYIAGFKKAIEDGADYIIQMDADLSHEPVVLPSMVKALEENDFVIGSRYIKGGQLPKWSLARKMISKGGNLYSRIILGFGIHDYTGGFNGFRKETLDALNLEEIKSNGYSFQIEMKYRAKKMGFKFIEVPIHFQDREHGVSKFSRGIFIEALINTLKLRFSL